MFAVIPPSKDDSRPRETSFDRSIPLPRNRPDAGAFRPRRRPNTSKWTQSSVTAFVVAFVPGTTRWHTNGCTTALQCIRQAPACSYLRPAPRLWPLNHPPQADTGNHPGRHSPSPVSNDRCAIGHVGRAG